MNNFNYSISKAPCCLLPILLLNLILVPVAGAALISTTTHGVEVNSLDGAISNNDLLTGMIALELPPLLGWHPANTILADQLPAFTDGVGMITGLTGLLNDFPGPGIPAKSIIYDLGSVSDIAEIQILSGNAGKDGRIFSTTLIASSNDGISFDLLGYFQSDPSGTINGVFNTEAPIYGSTLVEIYNDANPTLLSARYLRFYLYAVDNTSGQMRDPFDGVNPYTGLDDGFTAAFVSPLILEIDATGVTPTTIPEPSTLVLLSSCLIGLVGLKKKFGR